MRNKADRNSTVWFQLYLESKKKESTNEQTKQTQTHRCRELTGSRQGSGEWVQRVSTDFSFQSKRVTGMKRTAWGTVSFFLPPTRVERIAAHSSCTPSAQAHTKPSKNVSVQLSSSVAPDSLRTVWRMFGGLKYLSLWWQGRRMLMRDPGQPTNKFTIWFNYPSWALAGYQAPLSRLFLNPYNFTWTSTSNSNKPGNLSYQLTAGQVGI